MGQGTSRDENNDGPPLTGENPVGCESIEERPKTFCVAPLVWYVRLDTSSSSIFSISKECPTNEEEEWWSAASTECNDPSVGVAGDGRQYCSTSVKSCAWHSTPDKFFPR